MTAELYDWALTATVRDLPLVSLTRADPNTLRPIGGAVTSTALELTEGEAIISPTLLK